VLVLITADAIHSASLGDSRALLGTVSAPSKLPVPKALNREEKKHLYTSPVLLAPVQLTKDQKPEDPDELERILAHGGQIKRINDKGKNIGPVRVFDSSGIVPGLAMSRSIGDSSGSSIGVISVPICTRLPRTGSERFIVLASDGVWDVMDNEDVVNFVETYRKKCLLDCQPPDVVNTNNTTVAQLLCEEARIRWLGVVAEEDVMIDDISTIVLQFADAN
jgi:serine/threonine protein phosphatase PrpC